MFCSSRSCKERTAYSAILKAQKIRKNKMIALGKAPSGGATLLFQGTEVVIEDSRACDDPGDSAMGKCTRSPRLAPGVERKRGALNIETWPWVLQLTIIGPGEKSILAQVELGLTADNESIYVYSPIIFTRTRFLLFPSNSP